MIKIGVTGHQNIPDIALPYIESNISEFMLNFKVKIIGISSLAVGADQIFAKNILTTGNKLQVIVPCKNYENTFKNTKDLKLYKNLLSSANFVEELNFPEPIEEAFLQAGKKIVDKSDILLAIWDGKGAKGKGGTADIVEYAQVNDKEIKIIWPANVSR